MAGRRRTAFRRPFRRPKVRYEWLGFRDGGAAANLDTTNVFEIIPPDGASSVVNLLPRIRRIVGSLDFSLQGSVVSLSEVGWILDLANVGQDQAIDNIVNPLTTDPDSFNKRGILHWQTYRDIGSEVILADMDSLSKRVEFDIKVNRPMLARDTLVLRVEAATTARVRVSCNLRCLIQVHSR